MIVLVLTALLIIIPLAPVLAIPASVAIAVLTAIAWRRRQQAAASLGLFAVACVALAIAGVGPQQILFPIAFAVYFIVVWRLPWLRRASAWLKWGSIDATIMAFAVAIATVSGVTLLAWFAFTRADLSDLVQTFVPNQPLWLIAPGAVVFSMLNAAIEEAAYRGILLSALDATLGPGVRATILQALAFGTIHLYGGFPRGFIGVALAFVYGIALGALRRMAGGLLAPWIAHVLTDIVIFSMVIALSRAGSA